MEKLTLKRTLPTVFVRSEAATAMFKTRFKNMGLVPLKFLSRKMNTIPPHLLLMTCRLSEWDRYKNGVILSLTVSKILFQMYFSYLRVPSPQKSLDVSP